MTKKEILLQILEKLKPYRDIAEGLQVFVKSEYASAETLDNIIHFLQEKIQQVKYMKQGRQEQKVKDIQHKATDEQQKDIQDAEDLLAQL